MHFIEFCKRVRNTISQDIQVLERSSIVGRVGQVELVIEKRRLRISDGDLIGEKFLYVE